MDTRFGVVTGTTDDVISFRQTMQTCAAVESIGTRSAGTDDAIVFEAYGLLEDVRLALDGDLPTAWKAAGRLATLLASKLSRDAPSTPVRGGLARWQKRMVRTHIVDRLQGPIRVGEMAKLVSLSPSYFSRAFKATFGERPHDYVMRTRIERVRTLMVTTSLSLSQIALACGLVDQAHLCRCFRQATGTTPGAWRHNHALGPHPGSSAI
jgi:AraC family transcriptional regulator